MKTPFVQIGISDQTALVIAHIREPGEKEPFSFVTPLSELNAEGLDKAIDLVGRSTLGLLSHWHPHHWNRFENLKFPFKAQGDLDFIGELQARSRQLKTACFIPGIEMLIAALLKQAPEASDDPVISTWPDQRARLEKYP